jgi:hypothetical protein
MTANSHSAPQWPSLPLVCVWSATGVLGVLIAFVWLGLFFWPGPLFQSSDLKTATSVEITYELAGKRRKSVVVDDPAELRELLAALEITRVEKGDEIMAESKKGNAVDFTLPGGTVRHAAFVSATVLDRQGWGLVCLTPRFYEKVCELASRAEGRPIDVLRNDN